MLKNFRGNFAKAYNKFLLDFFKNYNYFLNLRKLYKSFVKFDNLLDILSNFKNKGRSQLLRIYLGRSNGKGRCQAKSN